MGSGRYRNGGGSYRPPDVFEPLVTPRAEQDGLGSVPRLVPNHRGEVPAIHLPEPRHLLSPRHSASGGEVWVIKEYHEMLIMRISDYMPA